MAILTLEQKKALIEEQREAGRRQEAARTARVPNFEDVRLMIREEIRAALREERGTDPLLHATHCHTGAPQAPAV